MRVGLTAFALALLAASAVQGCVTKDTVLEANGPAMMTVTIEEQVYTGSEYKTVQELSFTQPVPWDRTTMTVAPEVRDVPEKPGKKQYACFNKVVWSQPCLLNSGATPNPSLFAQTCIPANNGSSWGGMTEGSVTGLNEKRPGAECEKATALSRNWGINTTSPTTVLFTYKEVKEVDECDASPTKRYVRSESAGYRVVQGCLLNAKPAGARPACKAGWVSMQVNGGYDVCVEKDNTCSLKIPDFLRCPEGLEATKLGETLGENAIGPAVVCSLCKPNTFKAYSEFYGTNLLSDKCQPCPEWTETRQYGSSSCIGCGPGQYPKNKDAPLDCTACPPGTFNAGGVRKCTKCPADFFQSKSGATECKRCPTAWKCLVPASALGKFADTPYRWDESGNPACLSKNGKECWKGEGSCAQKLQQAKSMLEAGKLKSLVCGNMHKKVWGITGYEDYNSWCSLTQRMFMRPGKAGVGATGCSGAATAADVAAAQTAATKGDAELAACESKGCSCPM